MNGKSVKKIQQEKMKWKKNLEKNNYKMNEKSLEQKNNKMKEKSIEKN